MSRVIKFEIMFLVSTKEFEKKVAKHYTTLDRMIDGSDSFDYSAVDIIAKRQFTGMQDVNGVEVYEGDQFHDGVNVCTIVFCDEAASFRAFDGFEYHELGEHTGRANIVGNIHESWTY